MLISLQGSLKFFRIADLLSFLGLINKSGSLSLLDRDRETFVHFDNGYVIFASSNQEKFRLSAVLLWRKKITNEQWQKVERLMKQHGEKFGKIAVQEKILTENELQDYLKIQVSEIIYDCFVWEEGRFNFVEVLQLPDHAVTINIDPSNLIMEGARRMQEWEQCSRMLGDKDMCLRVIESPEVRDRISLTLEEWKVLFLVDGFKSVEEIAAAAEIPRLQVYSILYGLLSNHLIGPVQRDPSLLATIQRPVAAAEGSLDMYSTMKMPDDTNLLVSPQAAITYKNILKVTLSRITVKKNEGTETIALIEQEYQIGRHPECRINLEDLNVSGYHARVFRGPEGYVIEDMDSRNGTQVNGERVKRHLLKDTDKITVGNTDLVYNVVYEVKSVPGS